MRVILWACIPAALLLVAAFLLAGCQSAAPGNSRTFQRLFPNPEDDFRQIRLGMHQDSVKARESGPVQHEDLLGLGYHYSWEGGVEAYLDYYVRGDQGEERVRAIQADIRFPDPLACDTVYRECQRLFNRRYGPSSGGNYGQESWQQARANGVLEAHLKLSELQQVLSINILLVSNK